MLLHTKGNLILGHFDNNTNHIPVISNNELVGLVYNTITDINNIINNTFVFKNIEEFLSVEEFKKYKINSLKYYYSYYINLNYPIYKQLNIIRLGNNYLKEDQDKMTDFIDKCREDSNNIEKEINSLNEYPDIIEYNIYKSLPK